MKKTRQIGYAAMAALLLMAGAAFAGTPPIYGIDDYEPDDTPEKARWMSMQPNDGSPLFPYRHNFDRPGDVDWAVFNTLSNLYVAVQTDYLFSQADTFISVFILLGAGEPVPDTTPIECVENVIELNDGRRLVPVGCNDNIGPGQRRSRVTFYPGGYVGPVFVRVEYGKGSIDDDKENKAEGEGEGTPSGEQTSYNLEAVYSGIVPGGVVVSVYNKDTLTAITTAIVREQPLGMTMTQNYNGAYTFGALSEGNHTFNIEAPGYKKQVKIANVSGGNYFEVTAPMEPDAARHATDYLDPPYVINLSELLRAIQFYNTGSFHCDPVTEDNYGPGPGGHNCARHDADYNTQDWNVTLSELLRLIQFYNSLGYQVCEGTEDGFCPN